FPGQDEIFDPVRARHERNRVAVKASPIVASRRAETTLCFDIAAFGVVEATPDMLCDLRRCPGPTHGEPWPPNLLKHSDEQTVAGLAAVLQAADRHHLPWTSFSNWGILAASHCLGRTALVDVMDRFDAHGACTVSPHIIPHRTLHSVSGML